MNRRGNKSLCSGPSWTHGFRGKITITDDLQVDTSGYLIHESVQDGNLGILYTQVSLDRSIAPYVDIYWSELSEPAGLTYGELRETANGASGVDYMRFYIADSKRDGVTPASYTLSKYTGKHVTYGELTSALSGLSANGSLLVNGSSIHFDTCALYKVSFTPAAGEIADVYRWSSNITETTSFFAPIGTPFTARVRSSSIGPTVSVTARITEDGIDLDGDFNGRMNITSQAGHCVPPDSDEDGVIDELDECPVTLAGNNIDEYGCSVEQNINLSCDILQSKNHGRYVRCVSNVLNDLIDQGLLSPEEKGAIMSYTARK